MKDLSEPQINARIAQILGRERDYVNSYDAMVAARHYIAGMQHGPTQFSVHLMNLVGHTVWNCIDAEPVDQARAFLLTLGVCLTVSEEPPFKPGDIVIRKGTQFLRPIPHTVVEVHYHDIYGEWLIALSDPFGDGPIPSTQLMLHPSQEETPF